ncbi:deoxynucleotidyltransferase terminal-interacting protein 2 [Sorex araneus]|uniref:deoxynucleotidyltransferase terminal-interacting protein 2 n=1 Tax=Sorex araneus TaxID=42254 RepID=UPI002433B230|nr:deoxynucleotidyltransferase terminal-interacting protein 2 [Sorex araneus]
MVLTRSARPRASIQKTPAENSRQKNSAAKRNEVHPEGGKETKSNDPRTAESQAQTTEKQSPIRKSPPRSGMRKSRNTSSQLERTKPSIEGEISEAESDCSSVSEVQETFLRITRRRQILVVCPRTPSVRKKVKDAPISQSNTEEVVSEAESHTSGISRIVTSTVKSTRTRRSNAKSLINPSQESYVEAISDAESSCSDVSSFSGIATRRSTRSMQKLQPEEQNTVLRNEKPNKEIPVNSRDSDTRQTSHDCASDNKFLRNSGEKLTGQKCQLLIMGGGKEANDAPLKEITSQNSKILDKEAKEVIDGKKEIVKNSQLKSQSELNNTNLQQLISQRHSTPPDSKITPEPSNSSCTTIMKSLAKTFETKMNRGSDERMTTVKSSDLKELDEHGSDEEMDGSESDEEVEEGGSDEEMEMGRGDKEVDEGGSEEVDEGGSDEEVDEGGSDEEMAVGRDDKEVEEDGSDEEECTIIDVGEATYEKRDTDFECDAELHNLKLDTPQNKDGSISLVLSSDESQQSEDSEDEEDTVCFVDSCGQQESLTRDSENMSCDNALFVIDKTPGLSSGKNFYLDGEDKASEVVATEEERDEEEREGDEDEKSEESSDHEQSKDSEFSDEDDLLNNTKSKLLKLTSSSIDPGLSIKQLGGLYISINADKLQSNKKTLTQIKEKKKDELLQKAVITPDFEKNYTVPPYRESQYQLQKKRRKEKQKTAGDGWFGMKAPELTDELKNDLKALKMRASMDPKRFYKKNDRDGFPKYFQIGTIADNPADFYHSRIPKKQRKRTIVEELLADSEFRRYNRRKYSEIMAEKTANAAGKKFRKKKKFRN